ncbi:glycosyltransferase family 2 protein [Kosmotoga pacifica]|uniref:glycosyltransferase family 2 protein n=1 Tax=Kosmotoga pacifica TaxID=1330330 RepID=UPI0014705D6C|nr:glycosyltransferase family 2 protein [Kosmotoga pacifica]
MDTSKSSHPSSNVAIIILNWNGFNDTIKCLQSVLNIDYDNFSIIVVDNHSTDNSVNNIISWLKMQYIPQQNKWNNLFVYNEFHIPSQTNSIDLKEKSIIVIKNDKNYGYAGGNNVALRYAVNMGFDYMLILNNDTVVDKEILKKFIAIEKYTKNFGFLGPRIEPYDEDKQVHYGGRLNIWLGRASRNRFSKISKEIEFLPVDHLSGCALFTKKEVIQKLQGFDEEYFLTFEDTDICYRAIKKNYRNYVVVNTWVKHKEFGSTPSTTAIYYSVRNRFLFMRKNGRWFHWFSFLPIYLLGTTKQIFLLLFKGNFTDAKAAFYGLRDAFLNRRGERKK